MMQAMMGGAGVPGEGLDLEIEGLGMIMLVDMSVRWGPDLDMLMKGLMVVMLVAHIKLAHLIGIQFAVMVMFPTWGIPKEKA